MNLIIKVTDVMGDVSIKTDYKQCEDFGGSLLFRERRTTGFILTYYGYILWGIMIYSLTTGEIYE